MIQLIQNNFVTSLSSTETILAIIASAITIIVGTLAILAKVPVATQWFAKTFVDKPIRSFPPKEKNKPNSEFYGYFKKCFDKAKEDIFITGDGFDCRPKGGDDRAWRFLVMMRDALRRNVTITRIETKSDGSKYWAGLLAELKNDYPKLFKLYIVASSSGTQLSSICVFDPESPTDSVVEIMLSTIRQRGMESTDLAGTGIFIKNEPYLARSMRDRITALIDEKNVVEAKNGKDVKNLIVDTVLNFAYGSNMCKLQMKKRIPSAEIYDIGFLENYKLTFPIEGTVRSGGVASVELEKGAGELWGVLWKMPVSQLPTLDGYEDLKVYDRITKKVKLDDGSTRNCEVYVAKVKGNNVLPKREYKETILSGAREAKLPVSYISSLEKISIAD